MQACRASMEREGCRLQPPLCLFSRFTGVSARENPFVFNKLCTFFVIQWNTNIAKASEVASHDDFLSAFDVHPLLRGDAVELAPHEVEAGFIRRSGCGGFDACGVIGLE